MTKEKDKDKILKVVRAKQFLRYKRKPLRLFTRFSTETLKSRRHTQSTDKEEKIF